MLYRNALLHIIFLWIFYFLWKKINPTRNKGERFSITPKYFVITFILGIGFDILGYAFALWEYHITSVVQYPAIMAATWLSCTPIMMVVYTDIEKLLSKVTHKVKSFTLNPKFYLILFLISGTIFVLIGFAQYIERGTTIAPIFFVYMLVSGMVAEESLLGLFKVKNLFNKISEGKIFTPITIIIAGFVVGLVWELFNTKFRLWTYYNLPPGKILGISYYVVGFYGTINYTYHNFIHIAKKHIFNK